MMLLIYLFAVFCMASDVSFLDISTVTDQTDSTNKEFYRSTDTINLTSDDIDTSMAPIEEPPTPFSSSQHLSTLNSLPPTLSTPFYAITSSAKEKSWNPPVGGIVAPTAFLKDSALSQPYLMTSWSHVDSLSPPVSLSVTPTVPPMESVLGAVEEHCMCRCEEDPDVALQRVNRYVKEIKTNLTMARNSTGKYQRKLISVPDQRPSAQSVGLAGISLCCITFSLLVVCDCVGIVKRCIKLKTSCRGK